MGRAIFVDGVELTYDDLSKVGARLEQELYERALFEMLQRVENAFFDDSLSVVRVNATTVTVKAGNGFQTDNTQVAPESVKRLIRKATDSNVTIAEAHATLNRIDIISVKANTAFTTASRKKKAALDGAVTTQAVNVSQDWQADVLLTAGTANASPAVPSTPSGYIKLAEILVTAVTGVVAQASITDTRTRFYTDNGNFEWADFEELAANPSTSPPAGKVRLFWKNGILYSKNSAGSVAQVNLAADLLTRNRYSNATSPVAVTSNHHVIELDLSTGNVVANLPAIIEGKPYEFKIVAIDGPNANTLTINRAGSDNIEQDDGTTGTSYVFKDLGRAESFYGNATQNVWYRR